MQQISLDMIRQFNQTSKLGDLDEDCLPEGYSYGSDTEDDNLPDPDQTLSEAVYDPYDDPESPFFRLPFNDDLPAVSDTIPEMLSKTLRGIVVDEDGWCTTDIPEGSLSVAGDVVERQSTEDPLPDWIDHPSEPGEESDLSDGLLDFDNTPL